MALPTEPVPDPLIGTTIHDYEIARKLGQGGMGAVYLARHCRLAGAHMVIKVGLQGAELADARARARFEREATAIARLTHEHIVSIVNFGTLPDGQLFLMMPLLEGETLHDLLEAHGGRIGEHRALLLAVQLADALDYAHGKGVIHRDLKPSNIFVGRGLSLKLIDFGIAKVVEERDRGAGPLTDFVIGTPAYMAVEQFQRADLVTHVADVYALAVVIWEMTAGQLPWPPEPFAVALERRMTQPPACPPPERMPPRWADILRTALRPAPETRPQSARELVLALASALPARDGLPSGAEIVAMRAPHLLDAVPRHVETLCNLADVDRLPLLRWEAREARAARPTEAAPAPSPLAAGSVVPREPALSAPPVRPAPLAAPPNALAPAIDPALSPVRRADRAERGGLPGLALRAGSAIAGSRAGRAALVAVAAAAIALGAQRALEGPERDERAGAAAPHPAGADRGTPPAAAAAPFALPAVAGADARREVMPGAPPATAAAPLGSELLPPPPRASAIEPAIEALEAGRAAHASRAPAIGRGPRPAATTLRPPAPGARATTMREVPLQPPP
jgi:serine/threonine-protein kinase